MGPSAPPIRLVIADDHPIVREGLKSVIAQHPDLEVLGEVGDGDQAIGEVRTKSHSYATREHRIEGPIAERMQAAAGAAATKLIETYRWSLFTIGADSNSPLARLANDAMTWSSLIHTTYFDQPEVVDLVADYIGDEIGQPAAAAGV